MSSPRPHDLLRIASVARLCREGPAWVTPALRKAPWVVVRRARCASGYVPVGVRGPSRSHRHATTIEIGLVAEILTPPDLVARAMALPDLPVTRALHQAAAVLTPTGLRWGPAGSVGFSLATGVSVITASSDLDLVVTVDDGPPPHVLADMRDALRGLPARVDCQLDLPIGGVALDDLLDTTDRVLVRTADGPVLMNLSQLMS
jgi:phosphoribosyl-dephospho-CoA transferase